MRRCTDKQLFAISENTRESRYSAGTLSQDDRDRHIDMQQAARRLGCPTVAVAFPEVMHELSACVACDAPTIESHRRVCESCGNNGCKSCFHLLGDEWWCGFCEEPTP